MSCPAEAARGRVLLLRVPVVDMKAPCPEGTATELWGLREPGSLRDRVAPGPWLHTQDRPQESKSVFVVFKLLKFGGVGH